MDNEKWTMDNLIENKSFYFAVRIVKLCNYLHNEKKEYVLSNQILKSGTSIGANVVEAQQAQSKKDFLSKVNIALKEAYETDYWLRLLKETKYITFSQFENLYKDCIEIIKILISIVKTTKLNLK